MGNMKNKIKDYTKQVSNEIRDTKLLIKIIVSVVRGYLKSNRVELDDEEKKFIKDQSSDILKLIPLIVFQVIPGSTLATPFIVELSKKLGIKLNSQVPEKHKKKEEVDGELAELVNSDGTFIGSNIPLLQGGLHPRKTTDQTVAMSRQTNNPIIRGYRTYYGESTEDKNEDIIDEVNFSDAFGYEETKDAKNYKEAWNILKELGIEDPIELDSRLKQLGFERKYPKHKRRLSETEKQKLIKMVDEILLKKKKSSDDLVKKTKDEDDDDNKPINQLLVRNLQSIKRIADKEDIDINKLIKILRTGE